MVDLEPIMGTLGSEALTVVKNKDWVNSETRWLFYLFCNLGGVK